MPALSHEDLQRIQSECFAWDVPIDLDLMQTMDEELAREYFESGGSAEGSSEAPVTIDGLTVNLALAGGAIGLGVLLKEGILQLGGGLGGEPTAALLDLMEKLIIFQEAAQIKVRHRHAGPGRLRRAGRPF